MDCREGRGGGRSSIEDYEVGPRIGSGSFAIVYKATHKPSGTVVAVKVIDKKQLTVNATTNPNKKLGENLFKEISILSNIRHPNIIRLFDALQTDDKIYLVLEYCDGGDLASYLHHCRGKVSQSTARHFMRQIAAGLQVLNENRLIHRDLKPQNLLLSHDGAIPLLKIGDFGFARYLTPQGLADTLCGSPLYMAPEIIQNKTYDSKADLWSAGAILYQLVTGKPPFNGDSQLQLFQNILTSGELKFPQGSLEELHPDCINLCKSLLQQNPVERLTFEEFFNHKFLEDHGADRNLRSSNFSVRRDSERKLFEKDQTSISSSKVVKRTLPNTVSRRPCAFTEVGINMSNPPKETDSMDSIEKDYVLVNAHFASSGSFSCSLETSQLCNSSSKVFTSQSLKNNRDVAIAIQANDMHSNSICAAKDLQCNESASLTASSTSIILKEVHGLPVLHPSARIRLLHEYICILSELAQKKIIAGLFLESFAIELVVLAIWKQAIRGCGNWLTSTGEGASGGNYSANKFIFAKEGTSMCLNLEENVEFSTPHSMSIWAEQGFISAFDRAEKLSNLVHHMDGNAQMPDAMEIIFQTALEVGKSGGVDELMGNKGSATTSYHKAKLLLSFIMEEAESLALNPPFSLSPDDRERIKGYIDNFESRQSLFQL